MEFAMTDPHFKQIIKINSFPIKSNKFLIVSHDKNELRRARQHQ